MPTDVPPRHPGVRPARWLASVTMRVRRRYAVDRLRMVLREPDPAPGLWKVPARWLTGPVRVRRLGLRLELDLRDNLARTVYFTGTYEPQLVRFLSRLRPGEVFADVGAHIGSGCSRTLATTPPTPVCALSTAPARSWPPPA